MQVYVISINGDVQSHCHSTISGASQAIGVHRNTLQNHFKAETIYVGKTATVTVCQLIRIKGRGRKSF